jgi:WD40 repeat protein/DNA-binding SARP family transcriptional activator
MPSRRAVYAVLISALGRGYARQTIASTRAPPGMQISLLGPVEANFDGRPVALGPPQQRAVLSMLALQVNRTVSIDRLIEGLWGERAPPSAHKLVQLYVSHLRKLLNGCDAEIITRGRGYELRLAADQVDTARFEQLVHAAAHPHRSSNGEARQALALWRGPPLADVADEPFAGPEIRRLEQLRLRAAELAIGADLAAGRHGEVIDELEALVAEDPLREQLHAQHMLALYRSGRQAEALETYREVRGMLVEQIGVEPGPELQRLHAAILRQDAELDPAEALRLPPELDARTPLVGREAELDCLREHWRQAHGGRGQLVLVTGARGIGKTRLVAELAGELHAQSIRVVYVGVAAPDLAAALGRARQATGPGLIVFDDLDRASAETVRTAADLAVSGRKNPMLVVLAYRDDPPPAVVSRLAREVERQGAERLELHPLGADAVREIGELYVGQRAAAAPVEQLMEASGGVPRRIHELVVGWASRDTAERVGAMAGQTATRRGELREFESELIADVVDLHAVRERAELYSPTPERTEGGSDEGGVPVCPFKGLASFEASDADFFFGRERLVAELVARLVGANLLGVVGPSGSGKSSAVRAGLLPALASGVLPGSEHWKSVLLRPGDHPLTNLRVALGVDESDHPVSTAVARLEPGAKLLLAVDQFEETFAACRDELERAAFMDALADAAERPDGRVALVLAVRADYYGACAVHARLSRLLGESHVLVGPMQPTELAQAIDGPARKVGLIVEPDLVTRLVNDVAGQAGGLPLLSTALLELWQRREGLRMRLAAYEATGGVKGAVARLAEHAYETLTPDEQGVARRILLRLAGSGEHDAVVRSRVPLSDLDVDRDEQAARVLEVLARSRLVTVGEGTAEVAHEALLREWPRLSGWLEEDIEGRRLHRRVTDAAHDWESGGRDPGDLYRGARLASALDWATDHGGELNRLEREFLEESRLVSEREAERSRRVNRRLRTLLAGAAVALTVAIAAGLLALDQRGDARDAAVVADAQRLGAEAQTAERLENALLLARVGVELDESAATRSSLLAVLQRSPAQLGALPGTAGWQLWAVAVSPDGRLVAVGGENGTLNIYDAASRRPLGKPYRGLLGGAVNKITFSPDGSTLAVTGAESLSLTAPTVVHVIDPRTRERIQRVMLPSYPYPIESVVAPGLVFLPNGRDLVVEQNHFDSLDAPASMLTRVNLRTGTVEGRSLHVGRRGSPGLSATADGRRLFVTVPQENATYAVDPERLRVLKRYRVGDVAGAVSPDGRLFALGSAQGGLRLLDMRSGLVRRFRGRHEAAVDSVSFTADVRTVVSSGDDGSVIAWDVKRGELRETLSGHSEGGVKLAVSPDGRTLYSVGTDSRAIVWDLAGDRRIVRPFEAGRPFATDDGNRYPVELALSPDGGTLGRTNDDGTVDLIDTHTLRRRGRVRALGGFAAAVDFSPNGRLLAVSGEGGQVTLWDARTLGSAGPQLTALRTTSQALAFSPDSELLAISELGRPNRDFTQFTGGNVRVWDVRRRALTDVHFPVASISVAFSPDGGLLAAAGRERPSEIRNARSGELIARLRTADWGRSVAFSPDGSLVATGDWAGRAQLWSTETWKPVGRPLEGQEGRILTLDFSRDGRTLASASEDGTVVLWDVDTRTPVGAPLAFETNAWVSAAFTPDGSHLFAVSDQGRGMRLDVSLEAWKRHACRVAGREFTPRELTDALGDRPFRTVCPPG